MHRRVDLRKSKSRAGPGFQPRNPESASRFIHVHDVFFCRSGCGVGRCGPRRGGAGPGRRIGRPENLTQHPEKIRICRPGSLVLPAQPGSGGPPSVRLSRTPPTARNARRASLFARAARNLLRRSAIRPNKRLPNTHVPVVACRSAGIWTRGQLTAPGRPTTGGEPANPAQRGTRLEATTDRAFLVSAGPPKVGDQRGLSILPGVRTELSRPNDGLMIV